MNANKENNHQFKTDKIISDKFGNFLRDVYAKEIIPSIEKKISSIS